MDENADSSKTPEQDYDQFSAITSPQSELQQVHGLFDKEERAIKRHFTNREMEVLDIGCGSGRVSRELNTRGFDVTGVDISNKLIQGASSYFPEIEFLISDAANLPFSDNSFKYIIFAYNGIDYMTPEHRRKEAFQEIHRVLHPSGVFVFSSHNIWYTFPSIIADRGYIKDMYLSTENKGNFLSRYKYEDTKIGLLKTYFTNPIRVWRELRTAGFDLVDICGSNQFPISLFETSPYYVTEPR